MKFFDEDGHEMTMEEAFEKSPAMQARIKENERIFNMTREDQIKAIADRMMREPYPPENLETALELAEASYEAMTAEGQ
jgi:ribonuclease PH